MASASAGNILSALFVDFDNIYLSLKSRNEEAAARFARQPSVWFAKLASGLLIKSQGNEPTPRRRIAVARCYGNPVPWRLGRNGPEDPNCFAFVRNDFMRAGMEVVDCPRVTSTFKNCSDIRIACDIRDYLDHPVRFDEFIILSGDSDFTPVLLQLRTHDRRRAIYTNKSTSPYYSAFCDGWVEEADLISHLLQGPALTASAEPAFDITYLQHRPEPIPSLTPKPAIEAPETGKRRVSYSSDGAVKSLIEDFKIISQEITALIVDVVEKSPKPVPLAYLADKAQKMLGQPKTTGSNWAGCGNFLTFLTRNLPPSLKISEKPPQVVYNPLKHVLREENSSQLAARESAIGPVKAEAMQSAKPSSSERLADLRRSITRIYEACQAPPLPPSEYQLLFTLIALEVRERGFIPNETAQNVVSRASEAGLKLALKDVSFVLGAVDEIDPWLERTQSAAAVARAYRDYVIGRCQSAGLDLTEDEHQLIQVWFGASQWGQPRPGGGHGGPGGTIDPFPGPRGGAGGPRPAGTLRDMGGGTSPSGMFDKLSQQENYPLPPGFGTSFTGEDEDESEDPLSRTRFTLSRRG